MPGDFGWKLKLKAEEISKGNYILFFSANSGGVSGLGVRIALLKPGGGNTLDSSVVPDILLSNQSETVFWNEPELSDGKIFVTADVLAGLGEVHYGEHRYVISSYVWVGSYWLADQFATSHWYDLEKTDILAAEHTEIVARLRKVIPGIRDRAQ